MKRFSLVRFSLFFIILFVCSSVIRAQNLRQLLNEDGLASSAVMCIHQSANGVLWLGTLDGLNIYYGMKVERPRGTSVGLSLEGYIIERIVSAGEHTLWVQTGYGLKMIDTEAGKMADFPQFTGLYMLRDAGLGRAVVLDTKRQLYLYQPSDSAFVRVPYSITASEEITDLGGTEDFFWTAGTAGVYRYNWSVTDTGEYRLDQAVCLTDNSVKYCTVTSEAETLYIIDMKNRLYRLNIRRNEMTFILELGEEVNRRGTPSGIVEKKGAYFVSFKVGGVLKYEYDMVSQAWTQTDLGIRSGVFGMMKDKFQDIVWVASDGQGLFAYWDSEYNIRSYRYSDFSHILGKPVRALFVDNKDWLWIGTKGEGLLGIDRSNRRKEIYQCSQRLLTASNSSLEDNSVYALASSVYDGFWVGTDQGINFFDYSTRSLKEVYCEQKIAYVHSIQEVGDSVVWIATVGTGIFKAKIDRDKGTIQLKDIQHFNIDEGVFSSNYFFAMHCTENGELWLGNRGHGVFKMTSNGLKPIVWPDKLHSYLQNDVFALYKNKGILWAGTSCGLMGLSDDEKVWFIDKKHGLPNNIVHSMQADVRGNLWVATNNGIACLDTGLNEIKSYGRKDGLLVSEFSDGASLYEDSVLFFGGVNGWVEISNNPYYTVADNYVPPLYFVSFKEYGNDINIHLFPQRAGLNEKYPVMELEHNENTFSVEVIAMDYINSGDYTYLYQIDAQDNGKWIDNGSSNVLSFVQMSPGNYMLHVKYRSHTTGFESKAICMKIHIKPLWWQSTYMKFVYWSLLIIGISYLVMFQYRKTRQKHVYALQQLELQHKEELYEEKLRFFTNITHKFSTPLTLIYSPCERILTHEGTDEYVRKYVMLIKKHTERLYRLIQEIIDYRRIETRHQQLNLERYNLSEYMNDCCTSFADLAEKNQIDLICEIDEMVCWNMDRRCFPKIVDNLLSNALKYTPSGGTVKVSLVKLSEKEIQIKVYNTGKGIKEEDKMRIFNRYSVLDEVEENASNALSRNGLGMAICHSIVELLGGKVEINSEVGRFAEFVVTLPLLPLSEKGTEVSINEVVPLGIQNKEIARKVTSETVKETVEMEVEQPDSGYVTLSSEEHPLILVVDDNKDVLFLLGEVLSHSYEVKTARNAEEALDLLRTVTPHLIITDVMMPGIDGMILTKMIKQNKHVRQIPLIILSAKNTDEAKVKGLQMGADAYIGKPFNVQYLQAVVARLIENRRNMQEYYNTSACSFEYLEGHLVNQEDKDFVYRLNEIVEKNLQNNTLTIEMIAEALHISVRSLYRRLKDLDLPSPRDYAREWKMKKAVKLLLTTNLSIQEIMYECGFNNRAHFYKEFGKRYAMTPKEYRNQHRNPDFSLEKENGE